MELRTSKESVFLSEVVYDGQVEQGVEFDYVLPDYYPDIFKVLKCSLTPCVISYQLSGNQLYYDGVVYIKVLYLGNGSSRINCIEHRYTYSKTIELAKSVQDERGAVVVITPKTDYCNCRAVSGRRIDVRGAVSSKIAVKSTRTADMVTGAQGLGVEARKIALDYCGEKLTASRQFVVREDIETGVGSGGISSIIHHDAVITVTDHKIVANKVIVKGEATVKALYLRKSSNTVIIAEVGDKSDNTDNGENAEQSVSKSLQDHETAELMEATIPISQIIDLHGVTEEHICFVNLSVMDLSLELKSGGFDDSFESNRDNAKDGNRVMACELTLNCSVTSHLERQVMPIVDMYSVDYESSFTKTTIKTESMPRMLERSLSLKGVVESGEGNLEAVHDTRCEISNISCRMKAASPNDMGDSGDSKALVIAGQANLQVVGRLESGLPVFIEKVEQFELVTEIDSLTPEHVLEPNLQVSGTTYSISSAGSVEVRVALKLSGCLYQLRSVEIIKEIAVNSDVPKTKDNEYALKLYYSEKGEDVWQIAKRFGSSAQAIISENDMESEKVTAPSMLLIPIV
ncbi:MAG: DUF3794 domain-containing protein [Oscillospiraceae bacterium]|nr:DUF3794 domain-containing protein [Oscillospiraceae bacterium]